MASVHHDEVKTRVERAFEAEARRKLPRLENMPSAIVINSLSELLSLLVELGESGDGREFVRRAEPILRSHAVERLITVQYTLENIVEEYEVLRTVIEEAAAEHGWPLEQADISRFIEYSIALVTKHYVETTQRRELNLREELTRSQRMLEQVLNQLPVGVSIVEVPTGKRLYHNQEAVRLLGHAMIPSTSYRDYAQYRALHPDGSPYKPEQYPSARAATKLEVVRDEEMLYPHDDGKVVVFSVNSAPVFADDGKPYVAVTTIADVSQRKRLESELKQALQAVDEERKFREWLVATITHDVKNPITAAALTAQVLAKRHAAIDKDSNTISTLVQALERANGLLDDLMAVTRMSSGKLELERQRCDITQPITRAVRELTAIYGPRFDVRDIRPVVGNWDCNALIRVVQNLGANAVHYGASEAQVTIRLDEVTREALTFSVHNWGNPIPNDRISKLFELFSRPAEQAANGWGVGLAVVWGLVNAHQGRVWVTSSEAEGTTFHVSLPRQAPQVKASFD